MDKNEINDGDYVVFEKCEPGCDFEKKIVVAVINGMATIKNIRNFHMALSDSFPTQLIQCINRSIWMNRIQF